MKKSELDVLSNKALIDKFIEISLAQDKAELRNETRIWLRLQKDLNQITLELSRRKPDHREMLIPLYRYGNSQVRVNAAIATLAVAPALAREALEWIARWDVGSQRTEAIGALYALDHGYMPPS